MLIALSCSASAQYRTYRVVDNGIETIGYCKLSNGQVTHKFTSGPEDGSVVSEAENGSFTVFVPEHSNSEEHFFVGSGVSFDQVFNCIHARYCIRQGYLNFQAALKEKDPIAYQRKIKAIQEYYGNAVRTLSSDARAEAIKCVRALSDFTNEVPFMKGKPIKGYLPEYVRRVEKAMNSILFFDNKVKPNYSVIVHKQPIEYDNNKAKRRR